MGGGTTTTQDTQSQSVTQIPQWMQQAGQANYAFAQDVANRPLQQYQGQMVPDVAPQTQQAWDLAANTAGTGGGQYNAATAGYLNALGQTPMSVTDPGNAQMIRAGQLANTNLNPYMNPYTQSVINATLPIMQQGLALQQNQQQNQANAANAFGGSRQAVQQGVTQAQGALNQAQMAQQLNQANFDQAQKAAAQDIANRLTASQYNQAAQQANLNRNLTAQTTNQAAQQAKINSDILASQGLTSTGNALNQANALQYGLLSNAGQQQSLQAQNQINAQIAKFKEAWNYPNQQLNTLLSALGMTPHDTATTGSQQTQTTTPQDWMGQITQGLGGIADLAGIMGLSPSDPKVKKNITSLGADPTTGIPIKSFRYKGQPAGSPKVVGPLAPDIEKAMPGSTAKIGGIQMVPRPTLAAATPSVAHLPSFSGAPPVMGALSMVSGQRAAKAALSNPRAGARAVQGALANVKRPKVPGVLSGA